MPDKRVVTYLQNQIPQFENLSYQSLSFLLQNARIIDLHSRDQAATGAKNDKVHKIDDQKNLGFYMCLRGRAKIVFEVIKTKKVDRIDSSQEDFMLKQLDKQWYHGEEREDAYEEGRTLNDDQSK